MTDPTNRLAAAAAALEAVDRAQRQWHIRECDVLDACLQIDTATFKGWDQFHACVRARAEARAQVQAAQAQATAALAAVREAVGA
jgi:hypothetical protein